MGIAYQCDKHGNTFSCKACGETLRSSPTCDSRPFCSRKRCIKKRAKKVLEQMEEEKNQGGPALPIKRI